MNLKEAYRNLDPAHPIRPESPFYVARPDNPMPQIWADLDLSDRPRCHLITGHRGTGKTTELMRLQSSSRHSIATVSLADTPRSEDSTLSRLEAALCQSLGLRVSDESQRRRDRVALESELQDGVRAAVQRAGGTLLAIIDDADKLPDEEVKQVVRGLDRFTKWGLSTVCTVPLSTTLLPEFGELTAEIGGWHFLPGFDFTTTQGHIMGRDLLRRRTDHLFSDDAVDTIVAASGGIHRDVLSLAQRACTFAAVEGAGFDEVGAVRADLADLAIRDVQNQFSVGLRSEDLSLLARVEMTGRISGEPGMLRLVRNQYVIAVGGRSLRFAIHPLVRPLVEASTHLAAV